MPFEETRLLCAYCGSHVLIDSDLAMRIVRCSCCGCYVLGSLVPPVDIPQIGVTPCPSKPDG
jgi:hypothetical protein